MVKVKTFLTALDCFTENLDKFNQYFDDRRLTFAEKEILRALLHLRNGEYETIFSTIKKLQIKDPTVQAIKYIILGISYINISESKKSLEYLELSEDYFKTTSLHKQHFNSLFYQFLAYLNLNDINGMAKSLDKLENVEVPNKKFEADLHRARFNFHVHSKNYEKAQMTLLKINNLMPDMTEGQKNFFLTDKFEFFLITDQISEAQKTVNEMKKYRKFQIKGNYQFIKVIMDFCFKNKPLYLYLKDFEGQGYIYLQVKFLLALSEGNEKLANKTWEDLKKETPGCYQDHFTYVGSKCLFQMALDKIKSPQQVIKKQNLKPLIGDKEALCLSILSSGKIINQDILFKEIWGEEAKNKEELARLRKLISRIRSKSEIDIQSHKGSYFINLKKTA